MVNFFQQNNVCQLQKFNPLQKIRYLKKFNLKKKEIKVLFIGRLSVLDEIQRFFLLKL